MSRDLLFRVPISCPWHGGRSRFRVDHGGRGGKGDLGSQPRQARRDFFFAALLVLDDIAEGAVESRSEQCATA